MIEVEKSKDPIRLSFLQALLADAGIESELFDAQTPWPGALPARLMVADEDAARARALIAEAPPES